MTTAPDRLPLAFDSIDEVADALRGAGHRVSAPSRRVLEALFAADGPVSAERIADGLGGRLTPLELTSVYRNLERLENLGAVYHVHVGHSPGLYALARGGEREYLACERCGRVIAVDAAALDSVRRTVRKSFDFDARFSHFPIHGRCAHCAHGDVSHSNAHHEHQHSHGDRLHSHPHAHDSGLEHSHGHSHDD